MFTFNIDEIGKEYIVSVFDHRTGKYPINERVTSELEALMKLRNFINGQIDGILLDKASRRCV